MSRWAGQGTFWSDVEAIELAFVGQWAAFGQGPLGEFHNDGEGLVWTAAPVPELPYNAVLHTRLGADADDRVRQQAEQYRRRGVQFMWIVHPTSEPADLARSLAACGLGLVERSTGMSLDLARWRPDRTPPVGDITIREADDDDGVADYESLIAEYWELRPESREYVFGINRWARGLGHGRRLVAYDGGRPVGKGYLSLAVGPDAYSTSDDTAAIFGMYISPEARGKGIAPAITHRLLEMAAAIGRRRVVLHSSEMGLPLYLKLGFAPRCVLPVYATKTLHSLQPS